MLFRQRNVSLPSLYSFHVARRRPMSILYLSTCTRAASRVMRMAYPYACTIAAARVPACERPLGARKFSYSSKRRPKAIQVWGIAQRGTELSRGSRLVCMLHSLIYLYCYCYRRPCPVTVNIYYGYYVRLGRSMWFWVLNIYPTRSICLVVHTVLSG